MVIMIFVALATAGILLVLGWKYLWVTPDTAFSGVLTCGIPGSDKYGECLPQGCGRNGWTSVVRYTCPDEGWECCLLEEPRAWFTPGSIILAANKKYFILPSEQSKPFSYQLPPKTTFSIYYVPRSSTAPGGSTSVSDPTCNLVSNGKFLFTSATCPEAGGAIKAVSLYSGTGEKLMGKDLQEALGKLNDDGYFHLNLVVKTGATATDPAAYLNLKFAK
jgi:hypothetical protein